MSDHMVLSKRLRASGSWQWIAAAAALGIFWFVSNEYMAYVGALVLITAGLGATLNVALGLVGLFSLAHLAFYGLGAYVTVVLVSTYSVPFWWAISAGVVGASLLALLVGLPSIRYTRGLFFALVTFAFSEIVRLIATTWYGVTGGPVGLRFPVGIPMGPWVIDDAHEYLLLFGVLVLVILWGFSAVSRRTVGQRLLAIREDPYLAQAVGIDVFRYQLGAFTASAALAGLLGGLVASFRSVVTPELLDVHALVTLVGVVVVGGMGTVWGPVIGAAIFVLLPEFLRGYGHMGSVILGVLIVLVALYAPSGLLGRWRPERRLTPERMVEP